MAEDKKDVDELHEELKKALGENDQKGKEPDEASLKKPESDDKDKKIVDEKDGKESEEISEEEISKLSPRAQKRIRDLAAQVSELAKKPPVDEKKPEEDAKKAEPDAEDFKNVDEFLNAVEDEPSRELLRKFYKVVKNETSIILSPLEKKNNEARFDEEFSAYGEIEGISDYKNDLKKTFMRDPNQSVKALVGEVLADISLHKIKPIEKKPSEVNRDGEVNLDNLSLDELYALQESKNPIK